MRLHLRDRNEALVEAWRREFGGLANVEVSCGDIFDVPADAIVSPANSFGTAAVSNGPSRNRCFSWVLLRPCYATLGP